MVKKIIKTNPNLIELINKLNKQSKSEDAAIWKDVADKLSRSNRRTAEVNLSDIARYAEAGETVVIDKVLMVNKDGNVTVGAPFVAGAKVSLTVEENGKGKKVVVYKYKAKKNSRRKKGHRQPFTKVTVAKIEA